MYSFTYFNNLSLELVKNPATDFTNSRGFIKNSVKIGEIRGKKDRQKAIQKPTLNSIKKELGVLENLKFFFDLFCQRASNADVCAIIDRIQLESCVNANISARAAKNIPGTTARYAIT